MQNHRAEADRGFRGAKLMLFLGRRLLVLRRDRRPDIPWPGALDFPGGGREAGETPEACALRETEEEVGLRLAPAELVWRAPWDGPRGRSWFFAAHREPELAGAIRFGNEGLGWMLEAPEALLARDDTIPHFMTMLRRYLDGTG
ncbi:NUDIX domain-containing protein [Roseivivax sp. CAU 1761]